MGKGNDVLTRSDLIRAALHYRRFMEALKLPLNDETADTPLRVARMFGEEFCSHHSEPPKVALFSAKGYDQYVVETGIQFVSLCEHHHLIFQGEVSVGYHPDKKLAGLSKIPRAVEYFASRPQIQERLVMDIADYLFEQLQPHGLMVVAKATHSCVNCRGVRSRKAQTITSQVVGEQMDKEEMMKLMGL